MIVPIEFRRLSIAGGATEAVTLEPRFAILGGYSARAADVRDKHIEELREIGIEPAERIPSFWPIATRLIQTDDVIQVQGGSTSGEIEFALIFTGGRTYVSLASDQTDRAFEVHSIPRSKQLCPKVLSRDVLLLDELLPVWDDIVLSSEVRESDGSWSPYQRDTLAAVMSVEDILREAFAGRPAPDGTVLLSGTIPLLDGVTKYASAFRGRLEVPGGDSALTIHYEVDALPDQADELVDAR